MNASGIWLRLDLNPEPWAIGTAGVGRRKGGVYAYVSPNAQLKAYQNAVQQELSSMDIPVIEPGEYTIKFYFWRRLDDYEAASGKRVRKHQVDATNLQKGLEDALQGILFDNDKNVRDIHSHIVEQSFTVEPMIYIFIKDYVHTENIPPYVPGVERAPSRPLDSWDDTVDGVF